MRIHVHLRSSFLPALLGVLALLIPAGSAFAQGQQVSGHIYWEDENGDPHPAYRALVEVWQVFSDGTPTNFLDDAISQEDGSYLVVTPDIQWTGGEADLRVVVRSTNIWVNCGSDEGGSYPFLGDPTTVPEAGPRIIDFTIGNTGTGRAMSVFQAATWAARVLRDRQSANPPVTTVTWPDTANYFTPMAGGSMGVRESEAFDWDLIQHLYGHYALRVLDMATAEHVIPHNPGQCLSEALGKSTGTAQAWREGWSMFYACLVQAETRLDTLNIPRVGDTIYSDRSDSDIHVDLDAQSPDGRGEDNDLAIARFLWDLYDDDVVPEGRDDRGIVVGTLWNRIVGLEPGRLNQVWPSLMSASPRERRFVGDVGADHGIGPELLSPADGSSFGTLPTLSWTRAVGCSPPVGGDDFDVNFFNPLSSGQILTVPVGSLTSWAIPDSVVQMLRQEVSQEVLWAVSARNAETPATGPYRGETFLISINRPPDANIMGANGRACIGTEGTPIQFSGGSSTDPDGDDLTYLWHAPGAILDFEDQVTLLALFPPGETTLYLTVSDGAAQNTDSLLITISDDEPPTITCPGPLSVDCEEACATDAAVAAFLAGATATDNCDPDPAITHDAPACFPVGVTPVKFFATDGAGNVDSCTVNVTVVDNDPPTITATASRDLIWPPNQKMSPIQVNVVLDDNCDPYPDFVLSEILVLENGILLPDNQARHDYDGAQFGTDDAVFELRAERSGGTERKYAIVFVAFDASGNTAADTVCVRVPASQAGHAMASSGFAPDGGSLGASETFSLVIPSGAGFNAATVALERTYVGNHLSAVSATRSRMFLRDGEEIGELEVAFPTRETRALIAASGRNIPVSLHFTTTEGTDYLVYDILDLGNPVRLGRGDTDEDIPPVVDGTAGLSGAELTATPETPVGLYATRLERSGAVTVEVFTVTGRRVRTVFRDELGPGTYELPWDGKSDTGQTVPSGIYFYRITQPAGQVVRKVMIVR